MPVADAMASVIMSTSYIIRYLSGDTMDHILDTDSLVTGEDVYLPRRVLSAWVGGFGVCSICGETKKLQVDHDHDTDNYRGLLCRECNLGLGLFSDNITSLLNAVAYLRERTNAT
jgi:hypothetical protein